MRNGSVEAIARAFYEVENWQVCWERQTASIRQYYRQDAQAAVALLEEWKAVKRLPDE